MSVSAESLLSNPKKFTLPLKTIAKRNESKERITKKVNSLFLFHCLEEKEKNMLIDTIDEKRLRPGEFVFR